MKKYSLVLCLVLFASLHFPVQGSARSLTPRRFYFDVSGNDANNGSKKHPFKTIEKLNTLQLMPGDSVHFRAGQSFTGTIKLDSVIAGTKQHPIVIGSYGKGKAIINSGNYVAISLYKNEYITIHDFIITGAGRKEGNKENGVSINNCRHISVDSLSVSGFRKAGIAAYRSSGLRITRVHAYENGYAGISIEGLYGAMDAVNIYIADCFAENNPGDPANLTNHSGNGIVAGYCRNLLIEYCSATNNGWDMPRTGNGPVGIWAYETDNAVIQYCISYRNKTSKGGGDGGGFDLDGGITNSIIQYCISYENEGSGFGIFQYAGAGNWHNNIIRYNISENDGAISPAGAGVFIWNSSRDTAQFRGLLFHGNIIYNTKVAAISYDAESEHSGFRFYNNVFVAKDELVKGRDNIGRDLFTGNTWWSMTSGFNMAGMKDLAGWARKTGQEQKNGRITGVNKQPLYSGMNLITDPRRLREHSFFKTRRKVKGI